MPRRQDDLDLSLTGSQMNTARSTKSVNKRPSSSSGRPASARKVIGSLCVFTDNFTKDALAKNSSNSFQFQS